MTEGQEGTFKGTLFQWSDDDKATWFGFTSADGCCQRFNGVCSSNMLVKQLPTHPDLVSILRMCCFSPITVGCNMSFKINKMYVFMCLTSWPCALSLQTCLSQSFSSGDMPSSFLNGPLFNLQAERSEVNCTWGRFSQTKALCLLAPGHHFPVSWEGAGVVGTWLGPADNI